MKEKVCILFVVSQFSQGGAERYLYEVIRHLNKNIFDIEILTRKNVDKEQFYFRKYVELGIPIHQRMTLRRSLFIYSKWLNYRMLGALLKGYFYLRDKYWLPSFLSRFDVVSVIQIENYYNIMPYVSRNMFIHLMSHLVQYDGRDPYSLLDRKINYKFITMDSIQAQEVVSSRGHREDSFFCWPLAIDFNVFERRVEEATCSTVMKIGVFTRLSKEKPLDSMLEAFSLLAKKIDVTLHIYGGGDQALYTAYIESLGISDSVVFEGHCENMNDTLVQGGLSLCWSLSVNDTVGYSSIETAASMMPNVFWNLGEDTYEDVLARTFGAMHVFQDPEHLSEFSFKLLSNKSELKTVSANLYEYMHEKYSIEKRIDVLEKYFLDHIPS